MEIKFSGTSEELSAFFKSFDSNNNIQATAVAKGIGENIKDLAKKADPNE